MDRGDHVSDDSNIVRMSGGDGISHGKPSIHLSHGVGIRLSLSLTLAVQEVMGMRVDSSYSMMDRVDTSYMRDMSHMVVESSVVNKTSVVEGVSLSLSLTLAVHVVVVEGMRVDSSYMLDTSMDNRSYRSYTVDRVDTSYMMDSRDMSVIDSSYSVANSSVVDQ